MSICKQKYKKLKQIHERELETESKNKEIHEKKFSE
jgi:hypothetical protein